MVDGKTFDHLGRLLSASRESSGVPGAVAAVYSKGTYYEAASGVLNITTGVAATADSVFQIGSVTKPFTATLVMMLVGEGKLDLTASLTVYLPDFALAGNDAAEDITLRHLLTHTSGIDGDLLEDTGRGKDCIEKLVGLLRDTERLHAPGQFFSYCNVGYIILGRIIEVVEGAAFDEVLRRRLFGPLALSHAVMFAEDALFFNTAVGHETGPEGLRHVETAFSPRSNAPSGTTLGMSARNLLDFARFHMRGGRGATGEQLLAEDLAAEMQVPQVQIPLSGRYSSWGLGWMQYYWEGSDLFGHDGGTSGTSAYLRISPRHDFAAVLFANGPGAAQLNQDVMEPLVWAGTGTRAPEMPPPAARQQDFDLPLYCGRYERHGQFIDIWEEAGQLRASMSGEYMDGATLAIDIGLIQTDRAACHFPGLGRPVSGYFLEFGEEGRPAYFHVTERAFRNTKS